MTEKPVPPFKSADQATDAFIRHAHETRQKQTPKLSYLTLEPNERSRRTAFAGVLLGSAFSLVLALLSQVVYPLLIFGVRINASPFNTLLNILLILVVGTVLSIVAVSSIKFQNWIIGGGLALLGLFTIYLIDRLSDNIFIAFIFGMLFTLLIIAPLLAIFLILIRWAAHAQVNYFFKPVYYLKRAIPVLTLLLAVIFAARLFVYPITDLLAFFTSGPR